MAVRRPPVRSSPLRRARRWAGCRASPARLVLAWGGLLLVLLLAGRAVVARLPHEDRPRPLAVPTTRVSAPRAAITPVAPVAPTPTIPGTVVAVGAAAPEDGALPVVGPPSVSAALVDAVLAREGSPLAGQGAYIVAAGRRAGIDPVFLLAFVSHFDTPSPLPATAHNVGHVRAASAGPALDGYRAYPSWPAGIDAWYGLIRDRYVGRWGLRTLDAIVPIYAPSTQAGVEAELARLRAMVAAWRAEAR